jgi:2-polyprenyl-3-methyl-5-hydroxy-6-metoxy-1,4-benzoquinol methylase
MNFKDEFYGSYYRTHVLPRKGEVSKKQLDKKRKVFELHFREFLPADTGAAIVDAGCGSGGVVYWLHGAGYPNASGVDGSVDQIAAGQAIGIRNLEAGNLVTHLEANPGRFDLIFLRDVVEHFEKPHVVPLMRTCLNALRPGGRLVIQVPNGASPFVGRVLYGDFTHETAYTESSLSQIFLLTGFENFGVKPFLPHIPAISWRSFFRRAGYAAIARRLAWSFVRRLYQLMLFAEIGRHDTVTTYNIIATATRPLASDAASTTP